MKQGAPLCWRSRITLGKTDMKRLDFLNRYSPELLAVLRIMSGLLLLSAGLVKLVGFPAGAQPGQMPIMTL